MPQSNGGIGDCIILWPESAGYLPYTIWIDGCVWGCSAPASFSYIIFINGCEKMKIDSNGIFLFSGSINTPMNFIDYAYLQYPNFFNFKSIVSNKTITFSGGNIGTSKDITCTGNTITSGTGGWTVTTPGSINMNSGHIYVITGNI